MSTTYWKDVHNRLFQEIEDNKMIEIFSGNTYATIPNHIEIETDPQAYIMDAILIFMRRKEEIESMIMYADGGAYRQDQLKIESYKKMIARANAELTSINKGDTK